MVGNTKFLVGLVGWVGNGRARARAQARTALVEWVRARAEPFYRMGMGGRWGVSGGADPQGKLGESGEGSAFKGIFALVSKGPNKNNKKHPRTAPSETQKQSLVFPEFEGKSVFNKFGPNLFACLVLGPFGKPYHKLP